MNWEIFYTFKQLEEKKEIIETAKRMWAERCKTEYDKKGDIGSCVLGAGIAVNYKPPRCRHSRRARIITQNDVTNAQGSLIWEESVNDVISYLKQNGIECYYEQGRMD